MMRRSPSVIHPKQINSSIIHGCPNPWCALNEVDWRGWAPYTPPSPSN